jgi:trans-2-enoyl-CoA reductase
MYMPKVTPNTEKDKMLTTSKNTPYWGVLMELAGGKKSLVIGAARGIGIGVRLTLALT